MYLYEQYYLQTDCIGCMYLRHNLMSIQQKKNLRHSLDRMYYCKSCYTQYRLRDYHIMSSNPSYCLRCFFWKYSNNVLASRPELVVKYRNASSQISIKDNWIILNNCVYTIILLSIQRFRLVETFPEFLFLFVRRSELLKDLRYRQYSSLLF